MTINTAALDRAVRETPGLLYMVRVFGISRGVLGWPNGKGVMYFDEVRRRYRGIVEGDNAAPTS